VRGLVRDQATSNRALAASSTSAFSVSVVAEMFSIPPKGTRPR
jgi:hypothetical protein